MPAKSTPRRPVTIAEIAEEAGVSVATVSRVINKVDHPIDPATRKRVEEVVKRKNYTSNIFGKGLAGQPNIIGVSVGAPLSADPGFAQNIARIIDGIKSVTRPKGFHVLLETDASSEDGGAGNVFAGVPLAGVIHVAPRQADRTVDYLRKGRVPFVLIGSTGFENCNCVDVHNRIAGRNAARYLARLGRKRMAFFGGTPDFEPNVLMAQGFRDELERLGLSVRAEWMLAPPMDVEGGREAALRVFALKERPDSIFTFTDFLAVGALQAARELGFDVPADVSIVGYDDYPIATAVVPRLTTFRLPDLEMSAGAARILLDQIASRSATSKRKQELYTPQLIVRDSCGGREAGLSAEEALKE